MPNDERPIPTAELIRRWIDAGEKEAGARIFAAEANRVDAEARSATKVAENALLARFVEEGRVDDDGSTGIARSGVRWNGAVILAEGGRVRKIPMDTAKV